METIESKRLSLLGDFSDDHGLIIPIIYRGIKYLAPYIKDTRRTYYDFSGYIPGKDGENALSTHTKYAPQIKEIAEYAYDRYLMLNELWDMSEKCRDFELPSKNDAKSWLDSVCVTDARRPFPGRQGNQT